LAAKGKWMLQPTRLAALGSGFFLGAADSLPTISRQNLAPPFLLRADTWNFGMSVKWDCGSEMYGVDANP
jgi:hypothetical protein